MKVFVTGASGYIGTAVVQELLNNGHTVLGLARSDKSAEALQAIGAEVQRGDLDDLVSLRAGAEAADGVIHLAYMHDWDAMARSGEADLKAVQTFADTLQGTDKPFVGTSGSLILGYLNEKVGTEQDAGQHGARRVDVEELTLAMAGRSIRSSFVRLAPTVHSDADKHGFMPMIIKAAREKGVSPYIGDGMNRWPAVHRTDAARLFRLALEQAKPGTRLHGVVEEGVAFKDIAAVIGEQLNIPTASISADEAVNHFGFLGTMVGVDNPTSSVLTRQWLGWEPTGLGLLADLQQGDYFE